jgi:hypothetical protein
MDDLAMWLSQVLQSFGTFNGMSGTMAASAIITMLISSMKVSFLRSLIWDKLGEFKVFLAPLLSLVIALLAVSPFTLETALAALLTGGGAIALHELLDALKSAPFIGGGIKRVIAFIEMLLGGLKP